ncbi:hypothetical protein OKA05_01800 [Luteolibacter arcticus]|uniref:Uncharacterized protein n=1 Tax=Luteolibacter arcticus TaxID=1581411 RepID=A0ABT3GCB7_9BACT|nr:hypothetical protein [Luteolibacter arcticus]MCW1921266.1 hypothetical protein [Luteolibacter arcticus]
MNGDFLRAHVPLFEVFEEQRLNEIAAGSRTEAFAPDEANAANLGNGAQGFIDGIQDE